MSVNRLLLFYRFTQDKFNPQWILYSLPVSISSEVPDKIQISRPNIWSMELKSLSVGLGNLCF